MHSLDLLLFYQLGRSPLLHIQSTTKLDVDGHDGNEQASLLSTMAFIDLPFAAGLPASLTVRVRKT
jgi:hypothetical protein